LKIIKTQDYLSMVFYLLARESTARKFLRHSPFSSSPTADDDIDCSPTTDHDIDNRHGYVQHSFEFDDATPNPHSRNQNQNSSR
jgi:hypothetical protein